MHSAIDWIPIETVSFSRIKEFMTNVTTKLQNMLLEDVLKNVEMDKKERELFKALYKSNEAILCIKWPVY